MDLNIDGITALMIILATTTIKIEMDHVELPLYFSISRKCAL